MKVEKRKHPWTWRHITGTAAALALVCAGCGTGKPAGKSSASTTPAAVATNSDSDNFLPIKPTKSCTPLDPCSYQTTFTWSVRHSLNDLPHDVDVAEPSDGIMPAVGLVDLDACATTMKARISSYTWRFDDGTSPITTANCRASFPRQLTDTWHDVDIQLSVKAGQQTSTTSQHARFRDLIIASLGDSAASGEGAPDFPGDFRAAFQGETCDRSGLAASAQAAARLQTPATSITFWHLACAGARITSDRGTTGDTALDQGGLLTEFSGSHQEAHAHPLPAQIDQLEALAWNANRPVDALLLMAGANDLQWATYVKDCYLLGDGCIKKDEAVLLDREKLLRPRFLELAQRLNNAYLTNNTRIVEPNHVYLTQYWDPIHDAGGVSAKCPDGGFGLFAAPSQKVRNWAIATVEQPLDNALKDAARTNHWNFIDGIAAAFHDHGLCAPQASRWITTPNESVTTEPGDVLPGIDHDTAGAWHANAKGQYAISGFIYNALTDLPSPSTPDPTPTPVTTSTTSPTPTTSPTLTRTPPPLPNPCLHKPWLPICTGGR